MSRIFPVSAVEEEVHQRGDHHLTTVGSRSSAASYWRIRNRVVDCTEL